VTSFLRLRSLGAVLALGLVWTGPLRAAASDEDVRAQLDQAAAAYKQTAAADIQSVVAGVERIVAALQQGDIASARQAWIDARVGWERSEIFTVDLFPDLDKAIDDWPHVRAGFHALEARLFAPNQPPPITVALQLLELVQRFQRVFAQANFTGFYLIAGMATQVYDIGRNEWTGGESAASGTSLDDLKHNFEGLDRVWRGIFEPAVLAKAPELSKKIDEQIAGVEALLEVPTIDELDGATLKQESEKLAGMLSKAAVTLGWRAPVYEEEP